MRDRLIELLHDSDLSLDSVRLADYLLENGVVVPTFNLDEFMEAQQHWASILLLLGDSLVKRGEWLPYESDEPYGEDGEHTWFKCSNCGANAVGRCYEDEWYSYPYRTNYCHNCGTRMDECNDV